jgi:excisionase family DNA binding protein
MSSNDSSSDARRDDHQEYRQAEYIHEILDIREAARFLGLTVAGLRRMLREGRGPAYFRCGRLIRFTRESISAFIARNLVQPKTEGK